MPNAGVFTFSTANLGDDMQSLAVLGHLDRVATFVDRDHLADFDAGEDTTCVFNSWFIGGTDFRRPSSRVKPVWHGFCPGKDGVLENHWLEYLQEQQPIGCRDLFATERLTRAGIRAHWTGCLTLFLGQVFPNPRGQRRGVLFIDVPPAAEEWIPREIVQRAVRLSTFPAPSLIDRPLARWAAAAELARMMAGAELVVTRRLHAALPAASFDTPVVAIPDPNISHARRRFAGFDSVIPTVYLDELEALKRIDWDHVETAGIPHALHDAYAAFCATLRERGHDHDGTRQVAALDDLDRHTQRIANVGHVVRPGRVALRLGAQRFELGVRFWCDRYIDLDLHGFPGLSKFDFQVMTSTGSDDPWSCWGSLADLVLDTGSGD